MKKALFYSLILIVLFQPVNPVIKTWVLKADIFPETQTQYSSSPSQSVYFFNGVNSSLPTREESSPKKFENQNEVSLAILNKDSLLNEAPLGSFSTVSVTGYSSTPEETDETPFITASGKYVKEGIVAANFLPLGTKIRLPEIFGEQVFVVEDRMNKKHSDKIDVWLESKEKAQNFGVKISKIEIL